MGNWIKSEENYEASLNLLERLHRNIPDSAYIQRGLADMYNRMGDLYLEINVPIKALDSYHASLKMIEKLHNINLNSADFARDLYISLHRLVNFHYKQENKAEFIKYSTQCIDVLNDMKVRRMYMDDASIDVLNWLKMEINKN
jgi:tetratricopeptide (TPR) repeat protein